MRKTPAATDERQNNSGSHEKDRDPRVWRFAPNQEANEYCGDPGVSVTNDVFEFVESIGGNFGERVCAGDDDAHSEEPHRNVGPKRRVQIQVERVGANEGRERDNVGLPREMAVANPASGKRESNRERDPRNGNPRSAERLFKDPNHQARGNPGVSDARDFPMAYILDAQAFGDE